MASTDPKEMTMPQTYAQTHAQNRHHAGRNPREHGAPLKDHEDEQEKAVESGTQASPAGEVASTQEGGMTSRGGDQKASTERAAPDSSGGTSESGGVKAAGSEKEVSHPEPAEHNDSEKSKLPERGDAQRKQAPNDRPGKKSGEGETPVG
jgi:hypothetical protein